MNDDTEQLTETFAAHEHLAPDAADVLARAKLIARSYQRRRWAVRATGGAVLGAGIVAGGIAIPGRIGQASPGDGVSSVQAASGSDATPSAGPPTYTEDQEWNAYFAAGYDYNDAQQLAQLWQDSGDIGTVKAEAGLKLLEGQTLPVKPSGTPETPAMKAQVAFFAAGYDSDDAVTLGKMWKDSDLTQVKTEAGQKLLDGESLPIKPSGSAVPGEVAPGALAGKKLHATTGSTEVVTSADEKAIQAFIGAGYDYNDAVTLAKMWHDSDPFQVKADAGRKLLAGQTLPIKPSGTPETQAEKALAAYFAAGYDYNDAVTLAKTWNESDINQVKAEAGQKLLDGQKLPIAP